jgi:hypothetical protein
MKWTELKDAGSKRINAFPIGFAFSQKQFEDVKIKLGVTDTNDLCRTIGGGIIRKTDLPALKELLAAIEKEREDWLKIDENLIDALRYELGNHEFCYTGDTSDALDAVGVSMNDDRVNDCLRLAVAQYRKENHDQI